MCLHIRLEIALARLWSLSPRSWGLCPVQGQDGLCWPAQNLAFHKFVLYGSQEGWLSYTCQGMTFSTLLNSWIIQLRFRWAFQAGQLPLLHTTCLGWTYAMGPTSVLLLYFGSFNSTASDSEEKRDREESSKVILVILASLILSYLWFFIINTYDFLVVSQYGSGDTVCLTPLFIRLIITP